MGDKAKDNILFSISPEAVKEMKGAADFGRLFEGYDPEAIGKAVRSLAMQNFTMPVFGPEVMAALAAEVRGMVEGIAMLARSALRGEALAAQESLASLAGLYAAQHGDEIAEPLCSELEM